jgi:eukaryotic-like serine/threonine-protein kinase
MRSRSVSVRDVIRVNATSIDVTSSNAIAFGYVNDLARPGRIIAGRHRLLSLLPERGPRRASGSIWRAESGRTGMHVMVELLDSAIGEDAGLSDTFEWEARAAAAVVSPFVNRVLDFGLEGSTPYLVTQLPCGETLAEEIATQRRPTVPELGKMFREIAHALDEMHALDLVHRDLRSERIFLCRAPASRATERHVASLSFGIAKLMNDTLELVRTMARRAITPADIPRYASPEQVLGTLPVGPRSDLWSLAVIAFECMTGEMPFVGATLGEQLVQICTEQPRMPSTLANLPRGFDGWFARGVQKSPERRWGSALEMADALSSVLGWRASDS